MRNGIACASQGDRPGGRNGGICPRLRTNGRGSAFCCNVRCSASEATATSSTFNCAALHVGLIITYVQGLALLPFTLETAL